MQKGTVKETTKKVLLGAWLFFMALALASVLWKPSWFSVGAWFVGSVLVVTGAVILGEAGVRQWRKVSHPQSLSGTDWMTMFANVVAGFNIAGGVLTIWMSIMAMGSFVYITNLLQVISIPSLVAGVIVSLAYLLTK